MTDSPAHESSHRDHEEAADQEVRVGFAIVTFSDTRTEETDRSGALLRDSIAAAGHHVARYTIVRDDLEVICDELDVILADPQVHFDLCPTSPN